MYFLSNAIRRACAFALALAVGLSCLAMMPQRALAADTVKFETADGKVAKADSAMLDGVDFGINGFERNAKGTARSFSGQPDGYKFPIYGKTTLVTVTAPDCILVWVDANALKSAGLDLENRNDVKALKKMLRGLDSSHSMGGELLKDSQLPWVFTTQKQVERGDWRYRFKVAADDGEYYTVVTSISGAVTGNDLGSGAQWSDNARLVTASDVAVTDPPSLAERAREFFCGIDYRPFWVSVKTSAIALVFSFVLGLLAAWRTMGTTSRLKGLLDSVFTIPMVLPPTVCGFLLLLLFGKSTAMGSWLIAHGISVVFTWPAAVISAVVVSFPLMYRTALGAFEGLDPQMLDAARTLGWSELRIFRKLMMPLGWPSIAAGTVLAFARAMGEFGCTLFFAGNYAGITQTIPIAIYFEWMGGNTSVALFWVVVVIAFSFLVILFINIYTAHSQKYRSRGLTRSERRQMAKGTLAVRDSLDASVGAELHIDRAALAQLMGQDSSSEGDR